MPTRGGGVDKDSDVQWAAMPTRGGGVEEVEWQGQSEDCQQAQTQLIKASIAFRAKYSRGCDFPKLSVWDVGVHKNNRGGEPVKSVRTRELNG